MKNITICLSKTNQVINQPINNYLNYENLNITAQIK